MTKNQLKNFYYEVENLNNQQKKDLGGHLRDIVCGFESLGVLLKKTYESEKPLSEKEIWQLFEGYPAFVAPHINNLKLLTMKIEHDLQAELETPKNKAK